MSSLRYQGTHDEGGWKDTISVKTFLIVLVVVIVVAYLLRGKKIVDDEQHSDPHDHEVMDEIDWRVKHTLKRAGYPANFKLKAHKTHSFTHNKREVHVCTSCVMDNDDDLDKATYVGLHEAAHVLSRSHHHTEEWENILRDLMYQAADLGYLDPEGILL